MTVLFLPPLTIVNKGLLMLPLTPTVPPLSSVVKILLVLLRKLSSSTERKICLYLSQVRVGPPSQTRCLRPQNSAPLVLAIPITNIHGLRLFGMVDYIGVLLRRLCKMALFGDLMIRLILRRMYLMMGLATL